MFERNLKHDDKVLTMEYNNGLAITRYVQGELEQNATDEMFSRVSWDGIHERSLECRSMHNHGEAHKLVETITVRANGVFLWAALVMEAVCRHVALGCPVAVLQGYVGRLPTELSEYFQSMVFRRIHESMLSETAMALSIALLPMPTGHRYLRRFALLCEYLDTGGSCLTDPKFAWNLPYNTVTPQELVEITGKSTAFLQGCCRDILYVPPQPSEIAALGNEWHSFMYTTVDFSHRTMFDYLHTPEMQLLLNEHTPDHFKDALFLLKLDVAACKMVMIDPQGSFPTASWGQLKSCAIVLVREKNKHEQDTGVTHVPKILELAQLLEKACLFHLQATEGLSIATSSQERIQHNCVTLSVELAMFGLFDFTETLIEVAPYFLGPTHATWAKLQRELFQTNCDTAFRIGILRRLLQAGGDPSFQSHSLWADLLKVSNVDVILPREHEHDELEEIGKDVVPADPGNAGVAATFVSEDALAKSDIQDLVKMFVEFGAELKLEDVELLTASLPKPEGHNFDWPEFLSAYSQPAKRIELEEERRKRLLKWPKGWLTRKERVLLDAAPDLSEDS